LKKYPVNAPDGKKGMVFRIEIYNKVKPAVPVNPIGINLNQSSIPSGLIPAYNLMISYQQLG